ncbi:MAG: PASTA domain-containing protein [Rikenellaceae bacterium]
MSSFKPEDKLGWWGDKSDTSSERPKPKSKTASKPKSKSTSKGAKLRFPFGVRVFIHLSIIVLLVGVLSVVSHYLLLSVTRHNAHTSVPHFESMLIGEAQELAEQRGLNLVINDSVYVQIYEGGLVLEQNPLPGVEVKPGRTVYVTINALQREMVEVPYVAGRSLRQAKNMLEIAGLMIGELVYEPDLATNYVLSQSYNGSKISDGEELRVPRGSGIVLNVGINQGADSVVVPQLIGMSLYEARSALLVSGLNVGRVGRDSDVTVESEKLAQVVSQSIEAERRLPLGSRVAFSITLDGERVKRVLESIDEALALEQKMIAEEQALQDSLNRLATDMGVVEQEVEVAKPSGGSGFEDLF